ncbi:MULTISPECIES: universal stress protein [unclassified Cupriavidus]|uniref:universal stress protein n=1 Tax=unclassified Cupriavidus TaxID=2640874 RepID=UPI0010F75346|nr:MULTISPECIES: universal stress protein [unclassified Cupriavidus]MWL88932.1 universal stress protein [Cupriavidus sp. SW-Y-13]
MNYATILVHLDGSRQLHQRLHLATQIALAHSAKLIGLFAAGRPDPNAIQGVLNGDRYVASFNRWQDQARRGAKLAFEGATAGVDIRTQWREVDWGTPSAVVVETRMADLTILGQADPADPLTMTDGHFVDQMIMRSGRPAMIVPHTGAFPSVGRRVLIAWNGGAESARAIHDALPILRSAASVEITEYVNPDQMTDPWASPGRYAQTWLQDHGVQARLREATIDHGDETGELLLSHAADLDADLLVMGAYGHSRMRELMLGGVTAALLRSMTVPVLMSH